MERTEEIEMYLEAKEKPLTNVGSSLVPVLPGISNLDAVLVFGASEQTSGTQMQACHEWLQCCEKLGRKGRERDRAALHREKPKG